MPTKSKPKQFPLKFQLIEAGPAMRKLSDFFTRKEIEHIRKVCTEHAYVDATAILRPWFIERRKKLEAKGLVPEYAAYAIPYFIKEL